MYILNTNTAHMILQCLITIIILITAYGSMGCQVTHKWSALLLYCNPLLSLGHSLHELITQQLIIIRLLHYNWSLSLFSSSPSTVKNINIEHTECLLATSRIVLSTFFAQFLTTIALYTLRKRRVYLVSRGQTDFFRFSLGCQRKTEKSGLAT